MPHTGSRRARQPRILFTLFAAAVLCSALSFKSLSNASAATSREDARQNAAPAAPDAQDKLTPEGVNAWTTNFPKTNASVGFINAVAVDPNNSSIVYLGTSANNAPDVFRSIDGGATWTEAGAGLPTGAGYVSSIIITTPASNYSTLFAGTSNDGVYISLSAGSNWTPSLRSVNVTALAVDRRSTPAIVYAATTSGVYKYGANQSWTQINNGLGNLNVVSLAVDPSNSNNLFALTSSADSTAGVYATTSAGSV